MRKILNLIFLIILLFGITLVYKRDQNRENEKNLIEQESYVVSSSIQESLKEASIQQEIESTHELAQRLRAGEVKSISLIGDSITAGVGIDSHYVPEDGIIIFENETETFRESAHTANSWANKLREYINMNYKNIEVRNAGIGGKTAEWANENREQWILQNEDIVFVMLGTNDRRLGDLTNLEKNLIDFLDYTDKNSNMMIVMGAPPASSDTEYVFGSKEINEVLKRISNENNYYYISHYDYFIKYTENHNVEMTELIHPEGTHPLDRGYELMWEHIADELDLLKITNL